MGGSKYGKAPNERSIATGGEGDSLPEAFPHSDDAKNAPNKSKKMSGNRSGHRAGKAPGGPR